MRAGTGFCNNRNAFESGKRSAEKALAGGSLRKTDLALAFCGGHMDHAEFLRGLRSVIGETPVIGGSTIGVITNDALSYERFPCGAALVDFGDVRFQVASVGGLDDDEKRAGMLFAKEFRKDREDKLLLTFYDSIRVPASPEKPPVMNASPPLLEGIESVLQSHVPIIGAGLVGDYQFSKTKQFRGSQVGEQSLVGALISGPVSVYSGIMHGCSPIDGVYRTITKIEGSVIYELDGRPIVDIIDEIYGDRNWRQQHPSNLLTLGVNHGDRYEYREDEYVNRLITGMLPKADGIGIFEPDLKEGMEVQFMLRDGKLMIESAKEKSGMVMEEIRQAGKKPVFAFYIDCAGRAAAYSNTETEEAAEVQKIMNAYDTPLFGFYSGVEVAPIRGISRGLDWTGVLTVFAVEE